MSLFSKTEATEYLTSAKAAYKAAIGGKRYEIKDRQLARQDTDELYKIMNKWARYCANIDAGLDPDSPITTKRIQTVGI